MKPKVAAQAATLGESAPTPDNPTGVAFLEVLAAESVRGPVPYNLRILDHSKTEALTAAA